MEADQALSMETLLQTRSYQTQGLNDGEAEADVMGCNEKGIKIWERVGCNLSHCLCLLLFFFRRRHRESCCDGTHQGRGRDEESQRSSSTLDGGGVRYLRLMSAVLPRQPRSCAAGFDTTDGVAASTVPTALVAPAE